MNIVELKEMKKKQKLKRVNTLENELTALYREINDVNKANSYLVLKLKDKDEEIERLKTKIKELKKKD